MLFNIKYVYDKTKDGKRVLLGAKLYFFDGTKVSLKEVYVGIPFVLEDIMENDINANLLRVSDRQRFAASFNIVGASGIIYFPQNDTHAFLEENDEVILWNGEDRVEGMLEDRIDEYRNQVVDESIKDIIATKKKDLNDFDYGNSLAELCDCVPVRQRYSNR